MGWVGLIAGYPRYGMLNMLSTVWVWRVCTPQQAYSRSNTKGDAAMRPRATSTHTYTGIYLLPSPRGRDERSELDTAT